jgi:hypothetical protein
MTDDLVKRLKRLSIEITDREKHPYRWSDEFIAMKVNKAADRIEQLQADVAKLERNAISDAKWMAAYHKWCEMNGCAPSSSDLSAARTALGEKKND